MATPVLQFLDFPAEIIAKVFDYLEKEDLLKCSLTSRRLRTICQSGSLPKIWEKIHLYNPNPSCEYFMNVCTGRNPDDQKKHKMPGCLNINSKKVHGESLQYIFDKGCNYLALSHITECETQEEFDRMKRNLNKFFEPFKLQVLGTDHCELTKGGLKSYHVLLCRYQYP